MTSFWIEEVSEMKVFCKDTQEIDWNIAEFETLVEAQTYIDGIYKLLGNES
jgi:hypothetical protein